MGSTALAANHRGQQLTPFLTKWQVLHIFGYFWKSKSPKEKFLRKSIAVAFGREPQLTLVTSLELTKLKQF